MESVLVDDGDGIRKGQVLAALEPTAFDLAIAEAQARPDEAVAQLREAADTLERARMLFDRCAEDKAA